MTKNPCTGIVIKIDENILRKDVLSLEEEQTLINTHYDGENPNIRRAFIMCLYCGLRFCDVKDLTFANVDFANKLLKFEQNKTKGHSANSGVIIPLNDGLLRLIGEPTESQNKDSLIFPLPSYEMCLKALKRWVKRAGINKHISWHCARHSFAVNILNNGANIKTVASLLGHSGLKHTEKYTRAIDRLKEDAINSLPTLDLSTNYLCKVMYKDPLGNTYASYEEYVNSPHLDTDLIWLKLWRGERTPQNDEDRQIKKELDEMDRKGIIPEFNFD